MIISTRVLQHNPLQSRRYGLVAVVRGAGSRLARAVTYRHPRPRCESYETCCCPNGGVFPRLSPACKMLAGLFILLAVKPLEDFVASVVLAASNALLVPQRGSDKQ